MKRTSAQRLIAVLLIGLLLFCLAGCGNAQPDASKTKLEQIQEAGTLIVGTCADYPPYEFHTKVDGVDTIVGLDILISQYIADSLGVELRVVDMAFDSLLIGLDEGEFDLVMAGLTPDEDRAKQVDFTDVFLYYEQAIVIRDEDDSKYVDTDDLAGSTVAVQVGAFQYDIACELVGEDKVISLPSVQDSILEVQNGTVDVAFSTYLVGQAYVSGNPDLICKTIGIEYDNVGFNGAVKKGDDDLRQYINGLIVEMREQGLLDQWVEEACALAYAAG